MINLHPEQYLLRFLFILLLIKVLGCLILLQIEYIVSRGVIFHEHSYPFVQSRWAGTLFPWNSFANGIRNSLMSYWIMDTNSPVYSFPLYSTQRGQNDDYVDNILITNFDSELIKELKQYYVLISISRIVLLFGIKIAHPHKEWY